MDRSKNLQRLQEEEFDLCIIGGGASGAGCALDAALRGLKVALVEKTDFAAETSGKSTKLVHGGVRYLEQAFKKLDLAQLRQVRHGLEERHIVLQNAPHLAHPLGLITPVFSWWEGLYFFIGLRLYDWFAARKDNLPSSRWLDKKTVQRVMPGITPNIHSAVLYFDGQLDDARYCLALVRSAAEAGAVVVNHLEVLAFLKETNGHIQAATLQTHGIPSPPAPFHLRARYFLNCCGPQADHIRSMANSLLAPRMSPSKGVHLVLPLRYFDSEYAMLIPKTKDGRVVFAIPFEGQLLLGTTDDPATDFEHEPVLEASEVDFLLETLAPFVAEKPDKTAVQAGFGGFRPLVSDAHKTTTKTLLRDHVVEQDPASGLISLMGGKWTTYRLMARDAIDFIAGQAGNTAGCSTDTHLLAGADGYDAEFWKKIASTYGFDADVSQHLAAKYGVHAHAVAALAKQNPVLRERLLPKQPFVKAEVVYACQEEMALTVRDFLARRIRLELTDWKGAIAAAPEVARIMGNTLGWTTERQHMEVDSYVALLHGFQQRSDHTTY